MNKLTLNNFFLIWMKICFMEIKKRNNQNTLQTFLIEQKM